MPNDYFGNLQQMNNKQSITKIEPPKIINKLNNIALEHNWNETKRVRTQIAIYSLQRAALRVCHQKEQEKKESSQVQEEFNKSLSKEVNFQKVATEYGDANSITKGVFSANGNYYITIGSSGEGHIWNSSDPNSTSFCSQITCFNAPSKLCAVDFHPRVGNIPSTAPNIITGSTTGDLQIWTLIQEKPEQLSVSRQGHSDRINEIKFIQNGSFFISASYDKSWILWDTKRLNKIFCQKGHEKQIHTACVHPDQSLILTADLAGFGMVWDLRSGQGIFQLKQSDSILCSEFAPNGFELAVAGKNNLISVFDLRRKKQLKRIPAHLKLISDLKYQKDGLYLASASHDNTVRLWHGQTYTPIVLQDIKEQHKITSIDINDGRLGVTGIDRKWSMYINKNKWKNIVEQPTKMEE